MNDNEYGTTLAERHAEMAAGIYRDMPVNMRHAALIATTSICHYWPEVARHMTAGHPTVATHLVTVGILTETPTYALVVEWADGTVDYVREDLANVREDGPGRQALDDMLATLGMSPDMAGQ